MLSVCFCTAFRMSWFPTAAVTRGSCSQGCDTDTPSPMCSWDLCLSARCFGYDSSLDAPPVTCRSTTVINWLICCDMDAWFCHLLCGGCVAIWTPDSVYYVCNIVCWQVDDHLIVKFLIFSIFQKKIDFFERNFSGPIIGLNFELRMWREVSAHIFVLYFSQNTSSILA